MGQQNSIPTITLASDKTAPLPITTTTTAHMADLLPEEALCAGCEHTITITTKTISEYLQSSSSEFESRCCLCDIVTCLGCLRPLPANTMRFEKTSSLPDNFSWHCDGARVVLLWAVLCGYEEQLAKQRDSLVASRPLSTTTKKVKTSGLRGRRAGVGYGGSEYESSGSSDLFWDLLSGSSVPHTSKGLDDALDMSGTILPAPTSKGLDATLDMSGTIPPPATSSPLHMTGYGGTKAMNYTPSTKASKGLDAALDMSGTILPAPTSKALDATLDMSGTIPPPATSSPLQMTGYSGTKAINYKPTATSKGLDHTLNLIGTNPPSSSGFQMMGQGPQATKYKPIPTSKGLGPTLNMIGTNPPATKYKPTPITVPQMIASSTQTEAPAPILLSQNKKRKRKADDRVVVDSDDGLTARTLSALAVLLPRFEENSSRPKFDAGLLQVVVHLLQQSSILDRVADLLRNNSLDDIAKRKSVYGKLFEFMRALETGGPEMGQLLHAPRVLNGVNLLKASYPEIAQMIRQPGVIAQAGETARAGKTSQFEETAQSLASCAAPLLKQADTIMKRAGLHPDDYEDKNSRTILAWCKDIANALRFLQPANNPLPPPSADDVAPTTPQKAVLAVPDDQIFSTHHYAPQAYTFHNTRPGRMRHILKQITLLETSLPPGIFVRYAETRIDFMKILIVGPQGSPYANGLFEFDLVFPSTFPAKPPDMFFRTTGGGTQDLNPNLYADGKVCLSLLGTWQSKRREEMWDPRESSVLQVLISIQAMIFCEEPFCNEPHFERWAGSFQSKSYNRGLYPKVVKYGMLGWMKGEAGVFAEVVKEHFERNREQIVVTVNEWIKEAAQPLEDGDSTDTLEEFLSKAVKTLTKK